MSDKPYAAEKDGVRLAVRLTPRASRTAVDGIKPDAEGRPMLHIRVAAAPVDGAANAALVAFLTEALGLRKSDIAIRSGAGARTKLLHLAADPASLLARLERWLSDG